MSLNSILYRQPIGLNKVISIRIEQSGEKINSNGGLSLIGRQLKKIGFLENLGEKVESSKMEIPKKEYE